MKEKRERKAQCSDHVRDSIGTLAKLFDMHRIELIWCSFRGQSLRHDSEVEHDNWTFHHHSISFQEFFLAVRKRIELDWYSRVSTLQLNGRVEEEFFSSSSFLYRCICSEADQSLATRVSTSNHNPEISPRPKLQRHPRGSSELRNRPMDRYPRQRREEHRTNNEERMRPFPNYLSEKSMDFSRIHRFCRKNDRRCIECVDECSFDK